MSTQSSSADNPLASFGPNEWIVEDIYQQYLADPASVDPAWHDFFADYQPDRWRADRDGRAGNGAEPPPRPPGRRPGRPLPTPPTASGRQGQPGGRRPGRETAAPAEPGRRQGRARRQRPSPQPAPAGGADRHAARRRRPHRRQHGRLAHVPTATSVRAVPAKLIADNRIVINNHLARARGGKVSFTHLIGYALVKALPTSRR